MGARPRVASRPRRESARVFVSMRLQPYREKNEKKTWGKKCADSLVTMRAVYKKTGNSRKSTREQADKQDNRINKRPLAVRDAIVVAPNERKNQDS